MKLHHRILGEGKPMVILHGLFGYSDNWQTHAKKLAEYYQVILVDQRNHGHSDWSYEISYDLMAEDLKELFDELNLEEVILLGHSMGGKTAMKFAQNYPDYLEKLIVVDIGTKTYPSHHEQILAGLHAIDLNVIHSRSEAEEAMAKYIESNGVRQFLLKNLYWAQKGKLAWRMNIPVLEQEMWAILQGLPSNEVLIPTLFIRGMMSDYILGEDIPDLENQFSDSHFVSVENAGHWVHAEAPEEFIEAVLSFCLR
ncbi:MAG: alpha/beta fold hydrolase [Flavobacteriales bacterium]